MDGHEADILLLVLWHALMGRENFCGFYKSCLDGEFQRQYWHLLNRETKCYQVCDSNNLSTFPISFFQKRRFSEDSLLRWSCRLWEITKKTGKLINKIFSLTYNFRSNLFVLNWPRRVDDCVTRVVRSIKKLSDVIAFKWFLVMTLSISVLILKLPRKTIPKLSKSFRRAIQVIQEIKFFIAWWVIPPRKNWSNVILIAQNDSRRLGWSALTNEKLFYSGIRTPTPLESRNSLEIWV